MLGFLTRNRKAHDRPVWVSDYLKHYFNGATVDEDSAFVVLDCETTGLSKSDRVITIGAVKCTLREIEVRKALDQKYPEPVTGDSAVIHGELTDTTSESRELIRELIDYLGDHIIIGHNIAFDLAMIDKLVNETYGFKLKNKVLDTAKLAIRADPVRFERSIGGKSGLHLDDLCNEFNIHIENRHTALGDAYLTALLFQRLISQLRKRKVDLSKLV